MNLDCNTCANPSPKIKNVLKGLDALYGGGVVNLYFWRLIVYTGLLTLF